MSDSTNSLMARVRDSVAGTYDILGPLGADELGEPMLLARELATTSLLGLVVKQDDPGGSEYTIEVRRTLGESVAVQGSSCPECGTALPDLERFCFNCGADLSGLMAAEGTAESTRLLQALAAATTGRYEILGRMDRDGKSGAVYFARELASGRIVALRLRRAEPGDAVQAEYVVRQTQAFRSVPDPNPPFPHPSPAAAAMPPAYPPPGVPAPTYPTPSLSGLPAAAGVSGAGFPLAARSGAYSSVDGPATPPLAAVSQTGVPPYAASADATIAADAPGDYVGGPRTRPAWQSAPVLGGAAVLLLAVVAFFALKGSGPGSAPIVSADSALGVGAAAPGGVPAGQSAMDTSAAAASAAAAAANASVQSAGAKATDSGTVRLTAVLPEGARITIDGRTVRGRAFRVPAGSHLFAVSARGFEGFSQRVTVFSNSDLQWAPALVVSAAQPATTVAAQGPGETRARGETCRTAVRKEAWATAIELCASEANGGDGAAAASLGRIFSKGLGTKRDAPAGLIWYDKAAQAGNHDAQTALGYALRDGNGVKRDAAQSVKWFRQAAEGGDRAAQLEYAVALEKGDGVQKDETTAREWYRKSAEQGDFMASRRLGRMMERGAGGTRSDADAAQAYERAGTLGDVESALTVAKWYRDGHGPIQKDASKALTWFKKAADLGSAEAREQVKRLDR